MEFSKTIDIEAPPERVWAVMSDLERWPEWTESMRSLKRLDTGRLAVGSRVRVFQPRLLPTVFRVVALEENRGFTWETRSVGAHVAADHRIAPVGAGSRVTLSIQFGGPLGGLMGRLIRSLTQRYMELEASGLKRRSESTAT